MSIEGLVIRDSPDCSIAPDELAAVAGRV